MGQTERPARPRRESGLRRSLQEFLALPLAMVFGFITLAVITGVLDRSDARWLRPVEQLLAAVVPPSENQAMLRTVGPGVLTLMTITFFLLLTLVHRMADVFTWVVVEPFLLRRTNQAFFGYFAGLSVYYVIVVGVVDPNNAVFSTAAALVLSVVALIGLVVFGYLVLDQLRPPSVVEGIVRLTLQTRAGSQARLRRVRNEPMLVNLPATTVRAQCSGYLVHIDLDALARAADSVQGAAEIELCARLGNHIVTGSDLAAVRAERDADRERLAEAVLDALRCGRERQLDRDPVYGVHQLSSIGWAAATQRDPEAAMVAVDGLHTLLSMWAQEPGRGSEAAEDGGELPVVYRDTTIPEVLSALASIAVGAIEGGQHQTCAQVLNVFAMTMPRLSPDHQHAALGAVRRTLPTATAHPFSAELERALTALNGVLKDVGFADFATQLAQVRSRLDGQLLDTPAPAKD
ncbi:MAG: DUF2254 family protein [Mycobacterium sp.]|uniref:DUF2254 family protein n=1 Tax=Mycobacterium sp. TaxID=1785 RepID=UPI003CC67792